MEMNARYLETVIAGKAATLDRGNQQEVDAFNKLMKEYEKLMTIEAEGPKEQQTRSSASLDEQMKVFKEMNPQFNKTFKAKKGKEITSTDGFDMDLRDMANTLNKGKDL